VERGYRRKENKFLTSSLRRIGFLVSPSYRSRKVGSNTFNRSTSRSGTDQEITLLADQGQTNRSIFYWKQITIVVP
jgi:hypothetical protein